MIIVISDFDLTGSGYLNIVIALCNELAHRGYNIKALGMGYNGAEHYWDFSIIPIPHHEAFGVMPVMFHNLQQLAQAGQVEEIEAIIVALDIPMQERLLAMQRGDIPYVGIFPVESGPLCMSWANIISTFDERLVISKFGLRQMEKAGVPGIHFPVGLDTDSWRPAATGERPMLRESLGISEDEFVILTVADNQERKNLSVGAEIIRDLVNEGLNVKWNLVTRKMSPVGWKLDDLFMEYGIMENVIVYERGMPHDRLWILHVTSDLFMLTSKAEGLCMPVLEAMATKTPVIATHSTAMPEHLWEDPLWDREQNGKWEPLPEKGWLEKLRAFLLNTAKFDAVTGRRGLPIEVEFYTRDPWGNSYRAFASAEDGVRKVKQIMNMPDYLLEVILQNGLTYAVSRNWESAGAVVDNVLKKILTKDKLVLPNQSLVDNINPNTIPSPVPVQVSPQGVEDDQA